MLGKAGVVLPAMLVVLQLMQPAASGGGFCPKELEVLGACGNTDGTDVIIDGTRTTPGTDSPDDDVTTPISTDPTDDTHPTDDTDISDDTDATSDKTDEFFQCISSRVLAECIDQPTDDPQPDDDGTDTPPITISDVVRFTPPPTVIAGEPDNVGVAGMPANFVATASATTQSGTLFGYPVSVRFTPSAWVFHYGDGQEATTDTGGSTWAELGQAQFTPTATSHVYAERGTYQADVDVRYTAEVDFGFGWFPLDGEVTADGPAREIRVFEARTALVAYTCDQKPGSPGC